MEQKVGFENCKDCINSIGASFPQAQIKCNTDGFKVFQERDGWYCPVYKKRETIDELKKQLKKLQNEKQPDAVKINDLKILINKTFFDLENIKQGYDKYLIYNKKNI